MSNTEVNVKQSRFRDASWFEKLQNFKIPIVVGGVGGIGSWVALFLSRMLHQTTLFLFDDDVVEEVNMAGQFYNKSTINLPKVAALNNLITDFSDFTKVVSLQERYVEESPRSVVMFSCFDNMKARKVMFNNWKKEIALNNNEGVFIDGRLLAEQFQVFFITASNADYYEKEYLFSDSEVEDVSCSYKQTSHFAAMIAGKMVQGFTNWLEGEPAELPFNYEEIGPLFLTNIIE